MSNEPDNAPGGLLGRGSLLPPGFRDSFPGPLELIPVQVLQREGISPGKAPLFRIPTQSPEWYKTPLPVV
eukprot:893189-Rhodomonas_salina.1